MAALDLQARRQPNGKVVTFLCDGEVAQDVLTFSELRERSLKVARLLTSLGAHGQRAILLYPQGIDFAVAFFGCLYAGVIAVPATIPSRRRGAEALGRIAGDCGATLILSNEPFDGELSESIAANSSVRTLLRIDPEQAPARPGDWGLPGVGPTAPALLQYTSGSTGNPRGVTVTHANLVDNHRTMQLTFAHGEPQVIVSWLPMFHDMGLGGGLLMAVWQGAPLFLMSPAAFVQKPRRWLAAISQHRGTFSVAPDFAYDLCARRLGPTEVADLDLSSWRVAVNGSEPVRASTIERFVDAFAACGFRPETFQPAYGLAESTLLVTSGHPVEHVVIRSFSSDGLAQGRAEQGAADSRKQALVGCGRPWHTTKIAIVDPETKVRRQPGLVGEIWVSGPSVAAGYWGKIEETKAIFGAVTADQEGPFLRTGDLGFVADGELYVTGRLKDLIIIRGRNHYPQDIEASVSACHPALVPQGCAAFSVDSDQGEQLVIVQEVARTALRNLDGTAVVRAIRAAVSDEYSLHTHAVVLLKPATLPRTTSGKVRRKPCRQAFLDKSLPAVVSWMAPVRPTPETDAHPDSAQREASKRADRLIEWLRQHAADLISSYASDGRWTLPSPLLSDFAKQGLLGMQVEPKHGGLGLGHSDAARVLEQLASFDFALALFVGLNNYLGIQPVAKYASAQTASLLLPGLAQGEDLAAFAFQEPNSGEAMSALMAQAEPDGEEKWRLFGTKYLDGVAHGASVISVFARHDEPPGISAFVVSNGVEGLRHLRDGLCMGVLGFSRDTIVLDGVRVGRDNLLGSVGSGMEIASEAMLQTHLAIGAACVGGMKRCAQVVSRNGPHYQAPVVGKLTPNPVTLSRLGSVSARVSALECLVNRTARALDAGHAMPAEAFAACRILGPEFLLRSIDDIMQLGVSGGYADTNRILYLYRDAGLLRHFDGPPEAVAERTGAVVMEGHASLRLLVKEVFGAPDVVPLIDPVLQVVRERMANLKGPLARRAERWGHTRAGELATWLVLLAAVEGCRRALPSVDLQRAHAWARAQLDHVLSLVRFGTPSETATIDTSDVAATFAAYATTEGDIGRESTSMAPPSLGFLEQTGRVRTTPGGGFHGSGPPSGEESSKRELRSWLVSWLARRLQIPVSQVEAWRSFADHGLDSVASVELAKALSDKLGRSLDETLLWNFATIDALVDHLVGPAAAPSADAARTSAPPPPRSPTREVESQLDDEIARLEEKLRPRS